MTHEEAKQKALEWSNLIADAECEAENGCHGASERLLAEARTIEKTMGESGWDAATVLRQTQERRRAL
jgi:predicted transposase YdaD